MSLGPLLHYEGQQAASKIENKHRTALPLGSVMSKLKAIGLSCQQHCRQPNFFSIKQKMCVDTTQLIDKSVPRKFN
jgi:hypothetical protein